jgi:hypothetical protein
MRRFVVILGAVLVLVVSASAVDAQLNYGIQGAMITSLEEAGGLDGRFGVGGRIGLNAPLLPIGVYGSGTYYFPDDTAVPDLKYYTLSLGARLGIPLVIIQPYVVGGWQWRTAKVASLSNTENGAFVGVGVAFSKLFIEGSIEVNDEIVGIDTTPIVIKAGFTF